MQYIALIKLSAEQRTTSSASTGMPPCAHLTQRFWPRSGVRFKFPLYDVASTYFEGQ